MAALIMLSSGGIELAGVWREILSAKGLQLRAAGAWWLMAASAFLVGAAVTGALSRLPLPWHRFRLLRWLAGGVLVFGLAHVGHAAALKSTGGVNIHTAATFAALCAAALMALFGASISPPSAKPGSAAAGPQRLTVGEPFSSRPQPGAREPARWHASDYRTRPPHSPAARR